jgi:hypothetical protein
MRLGSEQNGCFTEVESVGICPSDKVLLLYLDLTERLREQESKRARELKTMEQESLKTMEQESFKTMEQDRERA